MNAPRYAELQVTTQFSFLRGASSAEELFATAATMGIEALAVVDRNSLAGIVRAHEAAKATGIRLIVGCRLDLACGMSVLVYPTDRAAYARLCRLLTLGKGRAGKGRCHLEWVDLAAYGEGLIAVLVPDGADDDCGFRLRRLRDAFGDRAYLALTLRRRPNDDRHHFRFIVSPDDAPDMSDLRSFTDDLVAQMEKDLGTRLDWVAVDHWNTAHPHVHLIVRGTRDDGQGSNRARHQ